MLAIIIILLGIIFGFCLFVYYKKQTVIYHGPNSNIIRKTIFKDSKNNKCYMFEPTVYLCPFF
jgi:hypothetical protein